MSAQQQQVPQDLLDILVCPVDHHKVNLVGAELICEDCGRAYPIRDGIPFMTKESARMTKGADATAVDDRVPGAADNAE